MSGGNSKEQSTLFQVAGAAERIPSAGLLQSTLRQERSAWPSGYNFGLLALEFLHYLQTNRRCSPRTVNAYRGDYQKTERLLKDNGHSLDIREISVGDLQVCIASLTHLSAASIERLIYSLVSFFKWLSKQGIIDRNPAADLARPERSRKLPRQFTRAEVDRLMAACETPQERVMVGLLRYCGLRRGELLALNVEDIAADYSSVKVGGKGNKERVIPLHWSLKALLREYIENLPAEDGPALIRNQTGRRMSPTTFWRLFGHLMRRAGLSETGLTPHALRHQFGTELVRAGVDVATIAELLGHSNISTTSVYLHTDSAAKRAAINRLPEMHEGARTEQVREDGWEITVHEKGADGDR